MQPISELMNQPVVQIAATTLALFLAVGAMLRRASALRGTTLLATWGWSLAALCAVAGCADYLASYVDTRPEWTGRLEYFAGCVTFCPLISLLGAKRPQDRAWQFIVVTLLVVLLLPAAESWLYRPRSVFELHPAWGWFLWILLAIELFNAAPPRMRRSGLLTVTAQLALLNPQLPLLANLGCESHVVFAMLLFSLAALLWSVDFPVPPIMSLNWNTVWLDFRDSFGAIWAVRIAERFNASATVCQWNVRLGWHGFETADERKTARGDAGNAEAIELSEPMQTALLALLRRFVSAAWIYQRVDCEQFEPPLN